MSHVEPRTMLSVTDVRMIEAEDGPEAVVVRAK